ncbi:hypothetical protein [Streptomyces sp. NPDC007346]|uniref:hypothetical protein n=1 Tax=Streptomyces sp. NPDC007346 TaxID=3154682 RepID=UPI003453CFBA
MIPGRPGQGVPPAYAPQRAVLRRPRAPRILAAGLLAAGLTVAAGPTATATGTGPGTATTTGTTAGTGTGTTTTSGTTTAPRSGTGRAALGTCAGPTLQTLDRLPGSFAVVKALGSPGISAGSSADVPVYWTGAEVHRVPIPPGNLAGEVTAINRHGLMVGTLRNPSTNATQAFSFRIGNAKVRLLPGGIAAHDVNDSGVIAGVGSGHTAVLWKNNTVFRSLTVDTATGEYGGAFTAVGINNAGTVIGGGTRYIEGEWVGVGLLWKAGTPGHARTLLPQAAPNEGYSSVATDISRAGRVVGHRLFTWGTQVYWDRPYTQPPTDVAGLPGLGAEGYFTAISPNGRLTVGYAPNRWADPGEERGAAQVWTGGTMVKLPRLDPLGTAEAHAAADDGRIGGYATGLPDPEGPETAYPVIWRCS